MPWNLADAFAHTKKATTPAAKRQWAAVANNVLAKTKSDATAVKVANGAVKKRSAAAKVAPRKGPWAKQIV